MPYYLDEIIKPYQQEDQDMWVGEISYRPPLDAKSSCIQHEGCIEVYAENKSLLDDRIHTIISALNDKEAESNFPEDTDDFNS